MHSHQKITVSSIFIGFLRSIRDFELRGADTVLHKIGRTQNIVRIFDGWYLEKSAFMNMFFQVC